MWAANLARLDASGQPYQKACQSSIRNFVIPQHEIRQAGISQRHNILVRPHSETHVALFMMKPNSFPRCPHGVYDPSRKGKAHHCGLCRTQNYEAPRPKKEKKFVMPHSFAADDKDKVRGNLNSPDRCPHCQSLWRFEIPKGRKVECAECGTTYMRRNAAA